MTELRETHISVVLLSGDRAYKFKKPLRLPFLDYSTLERRRHMCLEEVRLNRRLAPGIYRGVRAVVPAGDAFALAGAEAPGAVEYAVEMRRYDEHDTLARRLDAGTAGEPEVRAVGRRLAAFHAAADRPARPERSVAALDAMVSENFSTLADLGADAVDARHMTTAFLAGRREELERRAGSGRVRDCHGDLRAEHVVLEREIAIVDCVEFDPALREIDVGLDIAFLAMDLMRRDERLAAALIDAYRDAGGDPGDDTLVAFFAAQRALIRAKVSLMRAAQVEPADAVRRRRDATELLALADRLGWRVRLGRIAVVCGIAASGKSTLAAALARRAGASVVSSDRVRKALLGIAPTARAPAGAYDDAANRRTYRALGARARERLAAGQHVIVDATFRLAGERQAFAAALGDAAHDCTWLECRVPVAVAARRAAARARRPDTESDAGAAVAVVHAQEWDPLTDVVGPRVVVRTGGTPDSAVTGAAAALDACLRGADPGPATTR
jgi:aminoglycoside phosphotransferase family enzyme/predicted kinase